MSLTDDVQCHSRNSLKLFHCPRLIWSNSSLDLPKFRSLDSKIFKECKEFKRLTSIELWTSADSRRRTHGISIVFNKKSNPHTYSPFVNVYDVLCQFQSIGSSGVWNVWAAKGYVVKCGHDVKRWIWLCINVFLTTNLPVIDGMGGWWKACGQMQQMIGRLMPFFKLQNCTQNSRRPHSFVPRLFAESLTWTIFSEPHVGHNRFVLT